MFFLTRAAICIGLVTAVASAAGGGGLATKLDLGARDAAAQLGSACLASRRCLAIGSGVMAAALPSADPGLERPGRAAAAGGFAAGPPTLAATEAPVPPVPPERPARKGRHAAPPRA